MASNPKFRIMAGFRILSILNVRNPLTLGVLFCDMFDFTTY